MRRMAVLVTMCLVGTLGVLIGSEAVVPPAPAAALPPEGISVLAGTGVRGRADGPATTAKFDTPKDIAIAPDGAFVYVLDLGYSGRPNTIRKVDTATGDVSTFASGGLLAYGPTRIAVDPAGNVWASIYYANQDLRLLRFDSSGTPTTLVTGISNAGDLAFTFDPSGQHVYYANARINTTSRVLHRLAIPSSAVDADAGTSLGGPGRGGRGDVGDFAWSPQGELYMSWGATVTVNAPGLYRYEGGSTYTLVRNWVSQRHRFDFTATGGSLNVLHNDGTNDWLLRLGDFGAGPESILAGTGEGVATGVNGQFRNPRGIAFSPDGKVAFVADESNFQIRQVLMPPDPWELSADQLCGPCNRGQRRLNVPKVLHPVDVATGNMTESFTDLVLPGRGPAVAAERTYNSHFAGTAGLFGPGWSTPLDVRLELRPGTVVVHQENGATLRFARLAGGGIAAPSWVTSTLTQVSGGGWRLDRNHGDIVTFDSTGAVSGWEDRNGNVVSVTRSSGQIVMSTPGGRSLTFTVSSGRIASVSDDSSPVRTVDYAYTGGLLTQVQTFGVNASDPGRATWGYGYDTAGRLATVTDPRGNSNLTHYDTQGRVDYQVDFAGARSDIVYGGTYPNEWRTLTYPAHDALGTRAVVRYDLDGLLTESVTTGYGTASARTTTYSYDDATLGVESVTGPGAVSLGTYTYDAHGNVLTSTDAALRTTELAYADVDNPTSPTSVEDPDGNVTTLTYDDAGNLLSSSVPVALTGSTTSYGTAVTTYERTDPAHPEDLTAVIAPDQQGQPTPAKTVISHRAVDGQVEWVEDPEGNRTTIGYDSRGFVTSTVTPRGDASPTAGDYETTFVVNDFGMVASVTDPLGEVSSQLYDGNGNVVSATDANSQTSSTTYDEMDRPLVTTRADSSQVGTTYFPDGAVRAQVNGLGDETTYAYDVHGAVTRTTDANGEVTAYGYDALGRLVERVEPDGACPGTGCTTYGYDPSTLELTSVSYSDPATPDVTSVTYDALGQRAGVTRSAGGGQTWAWDNLGRLRASTDANGRTTAYGWTLNGNLTSVTYPGQATPVTYAYDAADRMTSVTDWAARTTTFGWTADSQWETTTFPSGTGNVDTRAYDEAGRLSSVAWAQGATSLGSLTYDRDGEGLLESETPTGGGFSTRTWGYDDLDQLDQVDSAGLALDAAGNLTRTEDGTFQVFDPAQQLCWTSPTATSGTCATPASDATTYAYDARGNRTAMAEPDLPSWDYGYDQESRMTSANQGGPAPISGMTGVPVAGDYDGDDSDDVFWYHAYTERDWMTWGGTDRDGFGSDVTEYEVTNTAYEPLSGDFDGDGNDDIFWFAPGTDGDFVWFWFNDGTGDYVDKPYPVNGEYRPAVGDFDGDGYSDVYWYGPGTDDDFIWWGNSTVDDTGGAFTDMSVTQGGSYRPIAGDFDGDGHDDIVWYQPGTGADEVWYGSATRNSWTVTSQTLNGTDWDLTVGDFDGDGSEDLFLYDGAGSQVWWGTTTRSSFGPTTQTSVTIAAGYDLEAGDFDGDGNDDVLLHDGDGPDDAWWGTSTRSALGTAPDTGLAPGTAATYAYGPDGLRNSKTVDGTTTEYTWDTAGGLPLLLGQHQGTATTEIVYGPGGTQLYEVSGSAVTYYHQDHQGSTRLTTDAAGAVVGRYAYSPYGELTTNTAPTAPTPVLGYTGQYTDAETGFIYLRARYMDPATGQFTTRDPLFVLTGSPYSYADGDPVNRFDPSGLAAAAAGAAAALSIGQLIGIAIAATAILVVVNDLLGEPLPLPTVDELVESAGGLVDRLPGFRSEPECGDMMAHLVEQVRNPDVPTLDVTGKVHGDIPSHVPDGWTDEELEELADDLETSIETRLEEQDRLGEDGGHSRRIQEEQDLLRQVRRELRGG